MDAVALLSVSDAPEKPNGCRRCKALCADLSGKRTEIIQAFLVLFIRPCFYLSLSDKAYSSV